MIPQKIRYYKTDPEYKRFIYFDEMNEAVFCLYNILITSAISLSISVVLYFFVKPLKYTFVGLIFILLFLFIVFGIKYFQNRRLYRKACTECDIKEIIE